MLKLLIIEDVAEDAELILYEFKKAKIKVTSERVETKEAFSKALKVSLPDLIISDFSLPALNAFKALEIRNELAPDVPFILATGATSEEVAVECLKMGADDYILKSSLTRLSSAAENAISRRKAEKEKILAFERVKEREEKYRNLFENSIVGIFRAEMDSCRLIEANNKAKEILGISDCRNVYLGNYVICDSGLSVSDEIFKKGFVNNYEGKIISEHGEKWVSVSARLFFNEGIIEGIITDITESKNNFLQLVKVNNELEKFAYHASHDLKSPLKSLLGLITACREDNRQEELTEYFRLMETSTHRMERLINDLLNVAKLNRQEIKEDQIDIEMEIRDCLNSLNFLENFRNLEFIVKVEKEAPFVSDVTSMRTILSNLLANAIKHHHCEGSRPFVKVNARITNTRAEISIQDNGRGIPSRHHDKIFNMFYRASSESDGSGLGLYIVKSSVEKLSGKLRMNSLLNKGTTFFIEIPNLHKKSRKLRKTDPSLPEIT